MVFWCSSVWSLSPRKFNQGRLQPFSQYSLITGANPQQEIDLLLLSTIPSVLLSALPFVFLTNELHVLPQATLQSGQPPPTIQISKWWSNSQVEEIRQEFEGAMTLGSATAEEWLKGLDERGRERKSDAARWERWERSELLGNITSTLRVGGPGPVKAEAVVKTEPIVKAESSTSSNGPSPITRLQPTNSLPQRNFPPFTGPRTQPSHPSLRKSFQFVNNFFHIELRFPEMEPLLVKFSRNSQITSLRLMFQFLIVIYLIGIA